MGMIDHAFVRVSIFPFFFDFQIRFWNRPGDLVDFALHFIIRIVFFNVSRRAIETKMPIFIYKNKYLFLQAMQELFLLDIQMHLILSPMSY
jgi:hypothetical protein